MNEDKRSSGMATIDAARGIKAQRILKAELELAEEKAIKALAGYKFMMFGYWAAIWVHLNQVGQFNRPSPFAEYVKLARKTRKEKKDEN